MMKCSFKNSLVLALAMCVGLAHAQYVGIDLGATGLANGLAGAEVGGYQVVSTAFGNRSHATTWGYGGGSADMHPSFLDSDTTAGSSSINGVGGTVYAGSGVGASTSNRTQPIIWRSGAASLLTATFPIYTGVALGTDGTQVVGWASEFDIFHGFPTSGPAHAGLWNAASGAFTDLSGSNNPTFAVGVAGGQQVGYEFRSNNAEARLWNGVARPFVNLHPTSVDASQALATDGTHQVGTVSFDVQVVGERRRGRRIRYNYATIWSSTPESFNMLETYPYGMSSANGINGSTICGQGMSVLSTGGIRTTHALAWVGELHTMIELHPLLPAGFSNSRANAVDAMGNIAGYAVTPDGIVHSILWLKL